LSLDGIGAKGREVNWLPQVQPAALVVTFSGHRKAGMIGESLPFV